MSVRNKFLILYPRDFSVKQSLELCRSPSSYSAAVRTSPVPNGATTRNKRPVE